MESTHDVRVEADRVTKRFVNVESDEPEREWRALRLLQQHAPDLAPEPLEFRHDDGSSIIVMSRLPGEPLGSKPLTTGQTEAVATALNTLHTALPDDVLDELPGRPWAPAEAVGMLREEATRSHTMPSAIVARAWGLGTQWVHSPQASELERNTERVFACADGNLANFIWDGHRCRIVDFEDSGTSDRAFELADPMEHVSATLTGALDAATFLACLDLDPGIGVRVHQARRAMAFFWLFMLLPGNPGFRRNPPGSADRQAHRLLDLLS